ncbi:MAG: homoserine kinase [Amphritea sp.]
MSVYTSVSREQLENYLLEYSVGQLIEYKGIEAGVENSNFFVTTACGEYVLTLVESVAAEKLPFILGLIEHLASNNVSCAKPVHLTSGTLFGTLNERPAILMTRLQGAPLHEPSEQQASVIGHTLARMHTLAKDLPVEQYTHIYQWCSELGGKLIPHLSSSEQTLLRHNLQDAELLDWTALPTGPVHADLFPDNAMFDGDRLCGLIDFYHACSAPYLYDLCITLNAWCFNEENGQYDFNKALLILESYQSIRPLEHEEQKSFSTMLQVAAMRFWLSRLRDIHFPKAGEVVTRKDPQGKRQLLELLRETKLLQLAS